MTRDPARVLLDGLADAARAFAAGDAVSASATLDCVVAACAALERAGVRLDPAALDEAQRLHAACGTAARAESARLDSELSRAGAGRRATGAYSR